ncbi:MAG TPA: D-sedoheptulose 7-phosphate isomerase [Armatimonadota bacterium]|nr:D-sedoheptulose 7-phosphate isomerase [Armatimonadota bacterium]HQK93112.1 D-sedoheptulose 7-phosphate isomerase [Armatimonadota bacterium]
MRDVIRSSFTESIALRERTLEELAGAIEEAAVGSITRVRNGGTVFVCGNGGSAADAQHIAGELAGRFRRERDPLPSICLSANCSTLTAISNDYSFEEVFSRPLAGLARPGDVLWAMSTSGASPNVLLALQVAKQRDLYRVGFSGAGGGPMASLCDVCLAVPSRDTARIQEVHVTIAHILCELIEAQCCGG